MTYGEALIELSRGAPEDALTDKVLNRFAGVAECLTDRAVTPALRAAIVAILKRAQRDVADTIQQSRRPRGLS